MLIVIITMNVDIIMNVRLWLLPNSVIVCNGCVSDATLMLREIHLMRIAQMERVGGGWQRVLFFIISFGLDEI